MNGGQVTLNGITDGQLEALLDVKKTNEGLFQLLGLQPNQPFFNQPPPAPAYYPGSPWGMGPGHPGAWYGPGSPFGQFPPGWPPPAPAPVPGQSTYNVTLTWSQDQGLRAIAAVFDRLATTV